MQPAARRCSTDPLQRPETSPSECVSRCVSSPPSYRADKVISSWWRSPKMSPLLDVFVSASHVVTAERKRVVMTDNRSTCCLKDERFRLVGRRRPRASVRANFEVWEEAGTRRAAAAVSSQHHHESHPSLWRPQFNLSLWISVNSAAQQEICCLQEK